MDILISCQGAITGRNPPVSAGGWTGHWIDAASALRMEKMRVIVLDPVNLHVITKGIASGVRDPSAETAPSA